MKWTYLAIMAFVAAVGALAVGSSMLDREAVVEAATAQAPRFEVDPMWPKPLPNHWVIGAVIGVGVDANDHVWIIHREGSLEEKEKYATWSPRAKHIGCSPQHSQSVSVRAPVNGEPITQSGCSTIEIFGLTAWMLNSEPSSFGIT